jgi:hypothetical protein
MTKPECILCKHFVFSTGAHDWSEWTPGSDAEMRCKKGHWRVDMFETTCDEVRGMLGSAIGCPDFRVSPTLKD